MIIKNKIGYGYDDLTIVPATISDVDTREQCNPFYEDGFLPIFTAPMASVVSDKNYKIFKDNKIHPIIPRNIKLDVRLSFLFNENSDEKVWVALSLSELRKYFIKNVSDNLKKYKDNKFYVCIDIANGHMRSLYKTCIKAKETAYQYGYEIIIMTGNVAKPETYKWICNNVNYIKNIDGENLYVTAVDYIRLCIGSGNGCFIDGTKIKTKNGEKNIEDLNPGDEVLTLDGSYQKVLNTIRYKSNNLIKINNEIISTQDHKYFVINKNDKEKVTEDNLEKFGYWIEANKLDKNKHLLIKKISQ